MRGRAIQVTRAAIAKAPIDVVWDTLVDHASYSQWTSIGESDCEVEGDPPPNGLGAVRIFRRTGYFSKPEVSRHEINLYCPPHFMGYRVLEGENAPAKDHQSIVFLQKRDGGTQITWHVVSNPVDLAMFEEMRAVVSSETGLQQTVNGLAAESERRARMQTS